MELNVAQYLAAITPAPGLIIIDCNPNMFGYTHPSINASAIPLVRYLRANGHPTTPIIMAEGTPYGAEWMSASTRFMQGNKSEALLDAYNTLTKGSGDGDVGGGNGGGNGGFDSVDSVDSVGGDQHLYYAKAEEADGMYADTVGMSAEVSGDGRLLVDPTCGGTHPTDLGMRKQASYWTRMITKVLEVDGEKGKETVAPRAQPGPPKQQAGREEEEGQRAVPQEVPSPFAEDVDTTTTASTSTTTGNVGLDGIMAELSMQQPHHNPHHHKEEEETAASETHTGGGANAVTWAWTDADPYIEGRTTYSPPLPRNSSYDRLPLAANGVVSDEVWRLSRDSTGMFMRFTTNASDFALKRKRCYLHLYPAPPSHS